MLLWILVGINAFNKSAEYYDAVLWVTGGHSVCNKHAAETQWFALADHA